MSDETEAGDGKPAAEPEAEDDMAADWAETVKGEGAEPAPDEPAPESDANGIVDEEGSAQSTRVLDQQEIDSLLGFSAGGEMTESGIRAIINSALVSYERLPMLEVVFDRLVRLLSTSLRNFTSDNVEVTLDSITSIRFGDYLNSIPLPCILSVIRAMEWDNYGIVTVDSSLVYSIVDVLLGGRRGAVTMRIEGRPYTTIERNLVERMVSVMLENLSAAFEPLSPVTFAYDRLETNPRFATVARAANAAILVKLRVDMEDRGGRIEILLPYATLEPVRELLLQQFMGEKFGRDTIWESHLATELWSTQVDVEAILDEQTMSLQSVMDFEVGSTVMLDAHTNSEVQLSCGGVPLTKGKMGRVGDRVAIQVTRPLARRPRSGATSASMFEPIVGLALDGLIAVLLLAVIVAGFLLNQRIDGLRKSARDLERILGSFDRATGRAQRASRPFAPRRRTPAASCRTR